MMIPFIVESDLHQPEHERRRVEQLIELAYLECKPLVLPSGWKVGAVLNKEQASIVKVETE